MIVSLLQKLPIVKNFSPKFIRYLITGITSLVADYGSFIGCYYLLHVSLRLSVLVGLALGFAVNFLMNKFWAFQTDKGKHHHPVAMQFLLYSVLFAVNYAFTYYFIHILQGHGMPAFIGKIFATGCITLWNYFVYKLAIFKEHVDVPVVIE